MILSIMLRIASPRLADVVHLRAELHDEFTGLLRIALVALPKRRSPSPSLARAVSHPRHRWLATRQPS